MKRRGRPPANAYWVHRINAIAADWLPARVTAYRVSKLLEAEWEGSTELESPPTQRTVARKLELFHAKSKEQQFNDRSFRIYEALKNQTVPVTASRVLLDLVRRFVKEGRGKPSVRLARWFWAVFQMRPYAPIEARQRIDDHIVSAARFAVSELLEEMGHEFEREDCDILEMQLAFDVWKSEENRLAFKDFVETGWWKSEENHLAFKDFAEIFECQSMTVRMSKEVFQLIKLLSIGSQGMAWDNGEDEIFSQSFLNANLKTSRRGIENTGE